MKKAKSTLVLAAKLLVSAALLVYFFSRIHPERFWQTFASADFFYIAPALVIYLVSQAVSAMRWAVLARPLGFRAPLKEIIVFYLIGMFFNLFAPGTVGGDVSRVYYLTRAGAEKPAQSWALSTLPAVVSVFMDRAVGMVVLVWLGSIGLMLSPGYLVPAAVRALTFALSIIFVLAGLSMPLLRRVLPSDGHPLVVKLRVALRSYRARWRAVPLAMLLSFVIHLIQAWVHVVLGRAIRLDIPFSYAIILYPLVGTFAAIPISLNGLGLREGGYMFLLGVIGVSSTQGGAFGLLFFMVVALSSLLGGLAFLLMKSPSASVVAASNSQIK